MAYISLGNLTRYDGKLKDWVDGRYASERYSNWQKTSKAGAVTCYPVPESRMEPVVEFKFKETLPADGEKGPDNPSTIEGVSSVKITRGSKNLFSFPYYTQTGILNGVTWTAQDDGSIIANGTTSNILSSFYVAYIDLPAGTYSVLLNEGIKTICDARLVYNDTTIWGAYTPKTFTLTSKTQIYCLLRISLNVTVDNYRFTPQLEIGSETTELERGISDTYNINLNGTYYGGYVDVANGILTVTHAFQELTSSSFSFDGVETSNGFYRYATPYFTELAKSGANCTCTHFPTLNAFTYPSYHCYIESAGRFAYIFTTYSTAADFRAWLDGQKLAGTPVVLCYELATPYTVLIPSTEIRSLPFLNKMQPRLNTLFTDAESIQVGYQKSPIRTQYELDNAILSLGGNE